MSVLQTKYIVYVDSGFGRKEISSHSTLEQAKKVAQKAATEHGTRTVIDVDEGYQTSIGWQVEFSDPDQFVFQP